MSHEHFYFTRGKYNHLVSNFCYMLTSCISGLQYAKYFVLRFSLDMEYDEKLADKESQLFKDMEAMLVPKVIRIELDIN